ncbi:MAG: hypothetical protein LBI10_12780 [Deltaproteobacteria bacterium]|nr:hypothetical protein [Deltaproteobacteria bacterium]
MDRHVVTGVLAGLGRYLIFHLKAKGIVGTDLSPPAFRILRCLFLAQ